MRAAVSLSPASSARFACTPSQARSGRRQPCAEAISTAWVMPAGLMRPALNCTPSPTRQVLGVSGLLAARLASQSLERRAVIELQARGTHRATRQLGPGKQIAAAGARQLGLGAQELGLRGARIAREVIALERFEGLPRIRLPIGRQRAAGTAGER